MPTLKCVYPPPFPHVHNPQAVARIIETPEELKFVKVGDEDIDCSTIDKANVTLARKRGTLLRKEQLSQGVLARLLKSLGRLMIEEVPAHARRIYPTSHDVCTHSITALCMHDQDPIVVLDMFCGTGSSGVAALRTGSYFIGMDRDNGVTVSPSSPSMCVRVYLESYRFSLSPIAYHDIVCAATGRRVPERAKRRPGEPAGREPAHHGSGRFVRGMLLFVWFHVGLKHARIRPCIDHPLPCVSLYS